MSIVLECNKIEKSFKDIKAINKLSFSIKENKLIGLIGRNGAGKTTLMKLCSGYLIPDKGELNILSEKPYDNLNVLSKLIYVSQEDKYNEDYRLKRIMNICSFYYEGWDSNFADKLISHFEINLKSKYKNLSTGLKSQFNTIVGLCSRCPVTFFDEPTLGLDAAVRKEFYSIILQDYMNNPRTIILSSHLLNEIEKMLEEIVLIDKGQLILHESVENLQTYAVNISGKREIVLPFAENYKCYKKVISNELASIVIENKLDDKQISYLKRENIDINKVSVEDLCILLTQPARKDGVFNVFK